MFDFFTMAANYEQRKVACFEGPNNLVVDTCAVTDSRKPFETAVSHPEYNSGLWVIVESYKTREKAEKGHEKWVGIMTANELPESLEDRSEAGVAFMRDASTDDTTWRTFKRVQKV
jgi:transposase